jgi:hypothetical protein
MAVSVDVIGHVSTFMMRMAVLKSCATHGS